MAQEESPREDLLREAVALVERVELVLTDASDSKHIVAGFRAEGGLSIYFGSDPAYHFNSCGQLRRAFRDGLLLKAEKCRLVSLDRRRQESEVQLVRHELREDETDEFIAEVTRSLQDFARQCDANQWMIVGCAPPDADVLGRLLAWIDANHVVTIADSPNVG
jgi:hypothetical protein